MNTPAKTGSHKCEFCYKAWGEHEQTCPYHPTPAWDRDNPLAWDSDNPDEDKDLPPERWRDRL